MSTLLSNKQPLQKTDERRASRRDAYSWVASTSAGRTPCFPYIILLQQEQHRSHRTSAGRCQQLAFVHHDKDTCSKTIHHNVESRMTKVYC